MAISGNTFCIDNGIYKVKGIQGHLGYVARQKELAEMNETSFGEDLRNVFLQNSMHFRWTIKDFKPYYFRIYFPADRMDDFPAWEEKNDHFSDFLFPKKGI